jgi:RNA polymerase sigma factor (sigma-70 family)
MNIHEASVSTSEDVPDGRHEVESRPIVSEFETFYRANVTVVGSFFARRSVDPHVVADLTSETFVRAMSSAPSLSGVRSPRAWVFAIARAVYARHQAELIGGRTTIARLSGRVTLQGDQIDDLVERIDAERHGRNLLDRAAYLSDVERLAVELVDLAGLTPQEAGEALGISAGAVRVRLFRARTRLRKESYEQL